MDITGRNSFTPASKAVFCCIDFNENHVCYVNTFDLNQALHTAARNMLYNAGTYSYTCVHSAEGCYTKIHPNQPRNVQSRDRNSFTPSSEK
jgi:hypothetical protein